MSDLKLLPTKQAVRLQNNTCPYCGTTFSDTIAHEKEHVIGRRFVPRGVLQGQWNLLVRSCNPCNRHKAGLEDDISAITMQPDASGKFVNDDPRLHAEAQCKAENSISRRTKKPVAAGEEPLRVSQQFGPASIQVSLVMPPQVNDDRLFELARFQIAAFFYMITHDAKTGIGGLLPGAFAPFGVARKADWGNPHMKWFMQTTDTWLWRVNAIGADGYFKIAIKRKSDTDDVWSWALEWNQNFRLVGFFGREELIRELWAIVPEMKMVTLEHTPAQSLRLRFDVPLADEDDRMFDLGPQMPLTVATAPAATPQSPESVAPQP